MLEHNNPRGGEERLDNMNKLQITERYVFDMQRLLLLYSEL